MGGLAGARGARRQSISDLFKCLDLDGKGHISREDFRSPRPHCARRRSALRRTARAAAAVGVTARSGGQVGVQQVPRPPEGRRRRRRLLRPRADRAGPRCSCSRGAVAVVAALLL